MAKFCGNCGAPLTGGKFCPHCGMALDVIHESPRTTPINASTKKNSGWITLVITLLLVVTFVLTAPHLPISRNPCEWCDDTPTKGYRLSDGSYCYICKDCRTTCGLCGRKAKHHYESLFGRIIFLCDSCHDLQYWNRS